MTTIDTRTTHVVPLVHPLARQPAAAGSKAAHLARAAGAGLPALPGFVILHGSESETPDEDGLTTHQAWRELSADGARPLVVRSSSPQEDTHDSSMAGQFASVLDVRGRDAFRAAVRTVLDSARRTRSGTDCHLTRRGRLLRTEPPGGPADPAVARPPTRAAPSPG
ncbi:PEP/pyruvate-binding domain-containing protein [Streptomyces sp. NPDC059679]|uniref:PEP/pyruvate-binding domain-containing protein n=1 Tax=Streptomyces sp. NPDC059679 TaxID=3346903 RepID=UPI0036B84656